MKFIGDKNLIVKTLSNVARALPSKAVYPVLDYFKINVTKDYLTILASNGDTTILDKLDTTDEDGNIVINVSQEGEFLLVGKASEYIRRLNQNQVSIETVDNVVKVSDGNSHYDLSSMKVKEYPDLDLSLEGDFIKVNPIDFCNAVNQVAFAASNKELTNILAAVNIKVKDNELVLVATDSNRLSRKVVEIEHTGSAEANIVAKTLTEIASMAQEKNTLEISLSQNRAIFKMDEMVVFCSLLTGNYPSIDSLLNKKYTINCKVNAKELIDAMERVKLLFIDRETNARLSISTDEFKIYSTSNQQGSIRDQIKDYTFDGKEFKICLECYYLISALRAFNSEYVTLQFEGEFKPFFIRSDEEPNLVQIITPLRVV